MFFNASPFRALEGGLNAAWMQQQLHSQNLSNLETPNYKTKSLVFDEVLTQTQKGQAVQSFRGRVVTDESDIRIDGNNVDVEKEGTELYKSYVQYSMLLDKVKGQFSNYNVVVNCNMK